MNSRGCVQSWRTTVTKGSSTGTSVSSQPRLMVPMQPRLRWQAYKWSLCLLTRTGVSVSLCSKRRLVTTACHFVHTTTHLHTMRTVLKCTCISIFQLILRNVFIMPHAYCGILFSCTHTSYTCILVHLYALFRAYYKHYFCTDTYLTTT